MGEDGLTDLNHLGRQGYVLCELLFFIFLFFLLNKKSWGGSWRIYNVLCACFFFFCDLHYIMMAISVMESP